VDGTYRIATYVPPEAFSGTYSFGFSSGGTGFFQYDGEIGTISGMNYDFGSLGSSTTSFGSSLTALVFGNPPGDFVIQDNTFFALNGGSAYGLRLRDNGDFCVRPDAGGCDVGTDVDSGNYQLSRVTPGELESGENVVAVPVATDESGEPVEADVVLKFDNVTETGEVTVTVIEAGSPSEPVPPAGFTLAGTTTYYDITTTSTFSDNVEVCINYDDSGLDESLLRLFHLHDGIWTDITSPDYPDTTNNLICGNTTSFSIVVPFLAPDDSDSDGLTDVEEESLGTNPFNPDTDADGLDDGTEVNITGTDPLSVDSDGDGLGDGSEVDAGTDPLAFDTDGDGLGDAVDPTPLVPGASSGFIEDELRQLGDDVKSLDLTLFDARNDSARKGRRNAIGNKLNSAANDVAAGYLVDALATLNSLLEKLDELDRPVDWMVASDDKTELRNNLVLMIGLIELQ
jgi:hypothetical protein